MKYTEAVAYTSKRFDQISRKTTYQSRCYEEWEELFQIKPGEVILPEDLEAFQSQPRGQGHRVSQIGQDRILLICACDSGD